MKIETIANTVLRELDHATGRIDRRDYLAVMQEIQSQLDDRISAVQEELDQEDAAAEHDDHG